MTLFEFEMAGKLKIIRRIFSWVNSGYYEEKTFNSSLTTGIKILAVNLRYR